MTQQNASETVQNLFNQQSSLLATKALLQEQLAATDKNLADVRAAIQGVHLGRALAEQEAAAKAVEEGATD